MSDRQVRRQDGDETADTQPSGLETDAPAAQRDPADAAHLIEIGWLVAGHLDEADAKAVDAARVRILETATRRWPNWTWRMPVIYREEMVRGASVEPTELLDHALIERNAYRWDFTFIVTGARLTSYDQPYALAVVSRAYEAAVVSTAQIDPRTVDPQASLAERVDIMTRRLHALAMHALGRLNGLAYVHEPTNMMYEVGDIPDLDRMHECSSEQQEVVARSLQDVADIRLEEQQQFKSSELIVFYMRSLLINGREILSAVRHAKPWQLPLRLSRLTVAALSTMLILLVTAETWDLALSQPSWALGLLSGLAVAATSSYVMVRQHLLLRRAALRLTEQTVVTNLSTVIIVVIGMAAAWMLTFAIAVVLTSGLFGEPLIARWAVSLERPIGPEHYAAVAAFVSSLGLGIGAVGASFEGQRYFRHVMFVDEEV